MKHRIGIFDTSSNYLNDAQPKRKRRPGDNKNMQSPSTWVTETVQATAEHSPDEQNISAVNGHASSNDNIKR